MSARTAPARSVHVICELTRMANCGHCWAAPQQPCIAGRHGADGYHLARFARAARRGLLSSADMETVLAAAGSVFTAASIVYDDMLGRPS